MNLVAIVVVSGIPASVIFVLFYKKNNLISCTKYDTPPGFVDDALEGLLVVVDGELDGVMETLFVGYVVVLLRSAVDETVGSWLG